MGEQETVIQLDGVSQAALESSGASKFSVLGIDDESQVIFLSWFLMALYVDEKDAAPD